MSEPQWQFGRDYDLIATSPEGAAGSIWFVRVQEDGSERAIKILRPELTGVAEVVDEFCALLDVVRALGHPGILVPDETVVHGNRVALVMTWTVGEDLGVLLRRRQLLTPASTVLMIADICDALAAAHAAGIVHGDVKPANVLLESDPETGTPNTVRLSDFGIAPLAARSGVAVLSAEYRSPESDGSAQRLTPASDVYGLGVVLYQALAGHPPFTGLRPEQIARLHREARPPRIPLLPDQLWLLVAACLNKNPEQRPTAAELADLLREIAPSLVALPAPENQDTARFARIPATAAALATVPASAEAAGSALNAPSGSAQVGLPDEARRPVFSGARGVALGVLSGVVVVSVALALLHQAGGPPPQTMTFGSATAPALTLGSPSAQPAGTRTTSAPSATSSSSATATRSPSPSAKPSAPTLATSPSVDGSTAPTVIATVPTTPSTAATSASPTRAPVTVNWRCQTNQAQHGSITKQSCIGIGSDGALYIRGTFSVSYGQIGDIEVSVYNGRQLFDSSEDSCGRSWCSITGGPYYLSPGGYLAYAGIDNWSHNEASPSVYYPGG